MLKKMLQAFAVRLAHDFGTRLDAWAKAHCEKGY